MDERAPGAGEFGLHDHGGLGGSVDWREILRGDSRSVQQFSGDADPEDRFRRDGPGRTSPLGAPGPHNVGTSNAGIGSFPTGIWVRPGDEVLFDLSVN